ncbi:sugar ABC transporter permease [Cohnella ginsengisoli]|uniref:Sugar ABC transporter permease n=1 Tax=Cohnella ginsengisoli TaxID=425004 RepID=A0A9X4QM52_9BACL|nr:sugar ABC transporter permease [Cohnella ginsengisoli]MDG0791554.1 sugar ABC transporter permease [Cohnella ginsengisoli]
MMNSSPDARIRGRSAVSWTGIAFLLPALAFISFSIFIPTVWNLLLSFQQWDGFKDRKWIGLRNYTESLKDPDVLHSLYHSIFLAVMITLLSVIVGLALAAFVFRLGRKEGSFYRLVLFMPVMLPVAIIGLLFTFMYNPEMGLVNQFLRLIGAGALADAWLENPDTVLWAIVVVGVWRMSGLTMMLIFAAMQNIPQSLFESARLEGAGYARQFFSIVLPLVKPILQLSVVFTLVMSFKTYDLVFVMTEGGPANLSKTIPLQMIDSAFTFNEFGYSAAMGFLLTLAVMLIISLTSRLLRGESYEY